MRVFTDRGLDSYVAARIHADRSRFMQSTADNAATSAVHNMFCRRTIDSWRSLLDEAEQSDNKYVALAELITKADIAT